MNVLGMRGLQSPGILPVKKAFVKFNLKGLVPPTVGTNLQNLKTEPNAAGANPTISTLMKFQVPLPIEPLYCPRLSCQVYDCIYTGWSQPIIGNFTIPIGELMHDLKAERVAELAELERMVEGLDKIAKGEARASFFQKKLLGSIEENMKSAGASEADLEAVRQTPKQKKKIIDQFTKDRRDSELQRSTMSLNPDDEDQQPLLTGDHNEELRQADRLHEKKENAVEGKMKRVTLQDIRESQKVEKRNAAEEETGVDDLLELQKKPTSTRASMRRESKAAAA